MGNSSPRSTSVKASPPEHISAKDRVIKRMQSKVIASKQRIYKDKLQSRSHPTFENEIETYYVYTQFLTSRSKDTPRKATEGSIKYSDYTREGTFASPLVNSKYSIPSTATNEKRNYIEEEIKESARGYATYRKKKSKNNIFGPISSEPKKPASTFKPNVTDISHAQEESLPSFDKISLLPPKVLFKVVSYTIDGFRIFLCVNPSWYYSVMEAFDTQFNPIEAKFINTYASFLLYKEARTSSSIMKFCDILGTRVDRVIRFEPLETTKGKTVTLEYSFKYTNDPKNTYKVTFIFDSLKHKPRVVWAHLNECTVISYLLTIRKQFHGEEETRANTQMIMPICLGDNAEIAVNYYSLRGVVDVESIEWLPIKLSKTPGTGIWNYNLDKYRLNEKDTTKKVFVDMTRVCELEDSEMWRSLILEKKELAVSHLEDMRKHFMVKNIEYSNVDILAFKLTLIANKRCTVPYDVFGINVRVKDEKEEITNEVKRDGLIFERHAELQFRIGDCFVFYHSKNGPEPAKQEQLQITKPYCIIIMYDLIYYV
eukprot:TRINITY_DN2214_c1_g2_i1.p1 TRINITY_DN2214_c1_g2~~TRINITY_DN2214_c1_g2_i1.p1  ORF type:complete len:541 (-),score=50.54 TRINITY_DN2214_c1_g2_i1:2226-3848(-)